jgi:hypothetical protein
VAKKKVKRRETKDELVRRQKTARVAEDRFKMKKEFVKELARYFCEDQATKSIWLQMGREDAKAWSRLRGLTPVSGWATVEEAQATLEQWLL